MAKTITEQLMALLSPEEQVALRAKLDANPALVAQDAKGAELMSYYLADDDAAALEAAEKARQDAAAAEAARKAAAATAAPTNAAPAATGNEAVLAEISKLSAALDGKIENLKKEFIPAAKLDEYRTNILGSAIKAADDYAQVRETHRAEFNEPIDRTVFEKFVADQQAAGIRYESLVKAHDAFVSDKRIAKKIETGVAEGVKTKLSASTVPGQTQSVALSPAQQVMAKARESAAGADGKSNAMAAAEKLANLRRAREDGGAAVN